jgi:hypothetical protein
MHSGKKSMLVAFVFGIVAVALFAYAAILAPIIPFPFICLFLSLIFACFAGYRFFFFSDDWYRARAEREQIFWSGHRRLGAVLVIISATVVVWQIAAIIRRHH